MTDRSVKASLTNAVRWRRGRAVTRLFDLRFNELWDWPSVGAALVIKRQAAARRRRVNYELVRASRDLALAAARAGRPRDQDQSGPGDKLAER